jgi:hypothetical protein
MHVLSPHEVRTPLDPFLCTPLKVKPSFTQKHGTSGGLRLNAVLNNQVRRRHIG